MNINTSAETVKSFSLKYNIPEEIVKKAFYNLNHGAELLAISGKIGAGKDTVAPLVLQGKNISSENMVQHSFAYSLKKEIQDIIDLLRINSNNGKNTSADEIAEVMGILLDDAELIRKLLKETVDNASLTSYSRTQNIRRALQYWGTDIRRKQDPDYWVKKCIQLSYRTLAESKSVYITDVRFPNEADAVKEAYGSVVRLDVSYLVQEQRITSRDGLKVSEEARNHPSETSLDDYEKFDTRINTDILTAPEVSELILKSLPSKLA